MKIYEKCAYLTLNFQEKNSGNDAPIYLTQEGAAVPQPKPYPNPSLKPTAWPLVITVRDEGHTRRRISTAGPHTAPVRHRSASLSEQSGYWQRLMACQCIATTSVYSTHLLYRPPRVFTAPSDQQSLSKSNQIYSP